VVDDNTTSREILSDYLTHWGMKPTLTDGSEAAMRELWNAVSSESPYSILLVDSTMPERDGFALVREIQNNPEFSGVIVLMLTAAQQLDDAERCRVLGIGTYVTKPLRQSELLDAIMTALGNRQVVLEQLGGGLQEPFLRGSRTLRLLLAEDNLVNQRLAVRLLERWGHTVVVVGNGRRAIEAWEREPFDAILMDVQMPEMSGFEAVAVIRQREGTSGQRVPIIAMTAHALEGDREKCLAAGMDNYVSKPIDQRKLFEAVEGVSAILPLPDITDMNTGRNIVPFDTVTVLKRVDGDRELLKEVAGIFIEDTPKLLSEIRTAISWTDNKALERAAHTLKSSVGNFGAKAAVDAAFQLEQMGRRGDFAHAEEVAGTLEQQITQVFSALDALIKEAA